MPVSGQWSVSSPLPGCHLCPPRSQDVACGFPLTGCHSCAPLSQDVTRVLPSHRMSPVCSPLTGCHPCAPLSQDVTRVLPSRRLRSQAGRHRLPPRLLCQHPTGGLLPPAAFRRRGRLRVRHLGRRHARRRRLLQQLGLPRVPPQRARAPRWRHQRRHVDPSDPRRHEHGCGAAVRTHHHAAGGARRARRRAAHRHRHDGRKVQPAATDEARGGPTARARHTRVRYRHRRPGRPLRAAGDRQQSGGDVHLQGAELQGAPVHTGPARHQDLRRWAAIVLHCIVLVLFCIVWFIRV